MITGAAQADVVLVVVPASTGEFEAGFGGNGASGEFISVGSSGGQTKVWKWGLTIDRVHVYTRD